MSGLRLFQAEIGESEDFEGGDDAGVKMYGSGDCWLMEWSLWRIWTLDLRCRGVELGVGQKRILEGVLKSHAWERVGEAEYCDETLPCVSNPR
jgi:hypothetical protein